MSPPTRQGEQLSPPESTLSGEPVFIALMGATGAGKSTFISHCTEESVTLGHNLRSCTQEVQVYKCSLIEGVDVRLIDTPGFDDTNRSDTQVLREIAAWLTASYANNIKLRGIIYLHRITDLRMTGSTMRNLLMFKKLCGQEALQHVILTTTMWESVDDAHGVARESELGDTEEFWGYMIKQGSKLERHTNDQKSAQRILSLFASPTSTAKDFVIDLQRQMVDQGHTLDQTTAGISLEREFTKERAKFKQELQTLKEEMEEAVKIKDEESARALLQERQKMYREIEKINQAHEDLKSTLQHEFDQKLKEIRQELHSSREDARTREARSLQIVDDPAQGVDTLRARDTELRKATTLRSKIPYHDSRGTDDNLNHNDEPPRRFIAKRFQVPLKTAVARNPLTSPENANYATAEFPLIDPGSATARTPSTFTYNQITKTVPNDAPYRVTKTSSNGSRERLRAISLVGDQYYVIGQQSRKHKSGIWDERSQHVLLSVALGTNGSWVQVYQKKPYLGFTVETEYPVWARNLSIEYPELYRRMTKITPPSERKYNTLWIECSLGNDGNFFNDAYIAVFSGGGCYWDLKGQYTELEKILFHKSEAPLMVGMNLKDDQEYIAIWPKGFYSYNITGHSISEMELETFLRDHGYE